jgi:hypothetical protein
MLNISNLAYFLDTIQTQKRKNMGAKSLGRYTLLCYQGETAIPMLFFSIIPSKLIFIFALNNYFANIRGENIENKNLIN